MSRWQQWLIPLACTACRSNGIFHWPCPTRRWHRCGSWVPPCRTPARPSPTARRRPPWPAASSATAGPAAWCRWGSTSPEECRCPPRAAAQHTHTNTQSAVTSCSLRCDVMVACRSMTPGTSNQSASTTGFLHCSSMTRVRAPVYHLQTPKPQNPKTPKPQNPKTPNTKNLMVSTYDTLLNSIIDFKELSIRNSKF